MHQSRLRARSTPKNGLERLSPRKQGSFDGVSSCSTANTAPTDIAPTRTNSY